MRTLASYSSASKCLAAKASRTRYPTVSDDPQNRSGRHGHRSRTSHRAVARSYLAAHGGQLPNARSVGDSQNVDAVNLCDRRIAASRPGFANSPVDAPRTIHGCSTRSIDQAGKRNAWPLGAKTSQPVGLHAEHRPPSLLRRAVGAQRSTRELGADVVGDQAIRSIAGRRAKRIGGRDVADREHAGMARHPAGPASRERSRARRAAPRATSRCWVAPVRSPRARRRPTPGAARCSTAPARW